MVIMGRVEYPTGKVLAPADYVTASEGFEFRPSYSFIRNVGGVVTLYLSFKATEAMTANTSYNLGTLNESIKPRSNTVTNLYNMDGQCLLAGSTGNLTLNQASAYSSGKTLFLSETYLI